MNHGHDLRTPEGRASYLMEHHYAALVRCAPGPYPSDLSCSTAEDAVQEVLHGLAAGASAPGDSPDELLAWTIVAVRRTNARLVRARLRQPPVAIDEGRATTPHDAVHAALEQTELLEHLRAAARDYGEEERLIAGLYALDVPRDEIAERVGRSARSTRRVIEGFQRDLRELATVPEPRRASRRV